MVVVFGGVGNLWGTLIGGMSLGIVNKLLEPYAGAVLGKILVLVALILFIQRRPRGLFPQTGRAAESVVMAVGAWRHDVLERGSRRRRRSLALLAAVGDRSCRSSTSPCRRRRRCTCRPTC